MLQLRNAHRDEVENPKPSLPPPGAPVPWIKIALAAAVLALAVVIFIQFLHWVQNIVGTMHTIGQRATISTTVIVVLVLYAVLIATPFMPGIEVGIALLMLQGAQIAPLVYAATVTGLMMAYLIGCWVPLRIVHRIFYELRMRKACALIEGIRTTPPEDRLAQQRALLPDWLGKLTVDYRYVTIAVLLNVPGTFAIGGGGGILMAAGLSRLFNGWAILLTLLIATLPVPLAVWLLGTDIFN